MYNCDIELILSEGIDSAKSVNSKEYIICNYWFFNHGSSFKILLAMIAMI